MDGGAGLRAGLDAAFDDVPPGSADDRLALAARALVDAGVPGCALWRPGPAGPREVARAGTAPAWPGDPATVLATGAAADDGVAALVPVRARGAVLAVLGLVGPAARAVEVAELVAHRLDVALLLERDRALRVRLALLTAAGAAFAGAATPVQVADAAVAELGRLLGTDSVAVFELRGADSLDAMTLGGWVEGARDAWTTMPLDAPAPVADAARTGAPVWSESSAAWHERYPHLVGMLDGYGYRGVLGAPLLAAGELVGALGIGFTEDRVLDADERSAVESLAAQCAQAMQRARLLQTESAARVAAERLAAVVGALSRARTPGQVVAAIGEAAASFGAASAVVALRPRGPHGPRALELLAADGGVAAGPAADAAHPLAHTVRTGEAVWLARRSELAWRDRSFSADDGPPVDLVVPMVLDDAVVGALGMVFDGPPPHHTPEERTAIGVLAAQGAQALDRARLQQAEHDTAETLQRGLLPERLPDLDRLEVTARYLPAVEGARAGGDWYDVLEVDGPRVAVVVGDVVGKGPAAAALMGQLRTALAVALLRGDGPGAALAQLDRFAARIPAARASTAVCVVVDWEHGRVCWANAGHPPPLVLDAAGPRFLRGGGPVLGLGGPFPEQEEALAPGSVLALFTDGLVERREEPLDTGLARLAGAADGRVAEPTAALAAALLGAQFADAGPADDVALVVARLAPPPLRASHPAVPEELRAVRRAVQRWMDAAGLPETQGEDLQFAFGEAVANSIEHAYAGRAVGTVEFELRRRGDGAVEVDVADRGHWRPPPEDPGFRGRGLAVIAHVAEDVDVRPGPEGTRVRFRVPAPDTAAPPPTASPEHRDGEAGLQVLASSGGTRVALRGDLDLLGAEAVRAGLLDAVDAARGPVELDLRGTGYVASAGVALLVAAVQRARARGVEVAAVTEPGSRVDRIIELSGVGAVLGRSQPTP